MNEGKEERSTDWLEGWKDSIATPAYVFDLDELKDRLQMIRRCLGNRIRLCYAMKGRIPFLSRRSRISWINMRCVRRGNFVSVNGIRFRWNRLSCQECTKKIGRFAMLWKRMEGKERSR